MEIVRLTIAYEGAEADRAQIDMYDVGQALIGFQRSLALTTHLVLNDEVITQAPSLRGAQVLALPPVDGSWKTTAVVMAVATGAYHLGTAPKDTPIGHLVRSAYDYVVSETIGVHIDYEKTLGIQYEELKKTKSQIPMLSQDRLDSLVEKCEPAIRDMHRPLVKSRTADKAIIVTRTIGGDQPLTHPLTPETYEYVAFTERSEHPLDFLGRVSSYNINTYKGRMYLPQHNRPVPFELAEDARDAISVMTIVRSLSANAERRKGPEAEIFFNAFQNLSRTGRLKSLYVTSVSSLPVRHS